MDLLKDYNYVPETDHSKNVFLTKVQGAFNRATNYLKLTSTGYDFMDLLKDNGYVPEIIEDETSIALEIENTYHNIVKMVEIEIAEYDFMDLLRDKGYVPTDAPYPLVAANDNDISDKKAA
jgi:hypothetical protein